MVEQLLVLQPEDFTLISDHPQVDSVTLDRPPDLSGFHIAHIQNIFGSHRNALKVALHHILSYCLSAPALL